MDIHEDPEVSKSEKVTRIGCGAILGLVLGISFVVQLSFSSFGSVVTVIIVAICVCAYLALKYGDEFWYWIFGRWW